MVFFDLNDQSLLTLTPIINIELRWYPNVAVRGSQYAAQDTRKEKQADEMGVLSASEVRCEYKWYVTRKLIWCSMPCNWYAVLEIGYNDPQGLVHP